VFTEVTVSVSVTSPKSPSVDQCRQCNQCQCVSVSVLSVAFSVSIVSVQFTDTDPSLLLSDRPVILNDFRQS
jgi:hypothetical protein